MTKRRFQRNTSKRVEQKSRLELVTFSVSEENHPKLRAAMHEAALAAVAEFPKTLELVKDQLRRHDPIGILACFAGYGLRRGSEATLFGLHEARGNGRPVRAG